MIGLLCALVSSACVTTTPEPYIDGAVNIKENLTFDLSTWMTDLHEDLHMVQLNQLAIPGSHDSFTAGLEEGILAPDSPEFLDAACYLLGYMCEALVYHWAKTQTLNITDQLQSGIRYLDLRISAKEGSEELYFSHGLFGQEVKPVLIDINQFLDSHPKEIVILDFIHFYGVTRTQHRKLLTLMRQIFGSKMVPKQADDNLTLKKLWRNKYQVIVIYHSRSALHQPEFWHRSDIFSPWADTDDLDYLLEFLNKYYNEGFPKNGFHVTQAILTPFAEDVIGHPTGSLKETLSVPAAEVLVSWFLDKQPGHHGLNICIMDFVENAKYIPTVIALNSKLLGSGKNDGKQGRIDNILERLSELKLQG